MHKIKGFIYGNLVIAVFYFLSQIVTIPISLFIANFFPIDQFGLFNLGSSILSYMVLAASFGLPQVLTREIAKNRTETDALVTNSILIKAFLSFAILALLSVYLIFSTDAPGSKLVVFLFALALIPQSLSLRSAFDSYQKIQMETALDFLKRVVYCVLALFVIFVLKSKNLVPVVITILASELFYTALSFYIFDRKIRKLKFRYDKKLMKSLLVMSAPVFISMCMAQIYNESDIIMLGILKDTYAIGIYAASAKLFTFAALLNTQVIPRIAFPIFSHYSAGGMTDYNDAAKRIAKISSAIAVPIAVVGIIFSKDIMALFFKPEYLNGVPVLQLLLVNVLIVGLWFIYGMSLLAMNKQKPYLVSLTLGAVINVAANIVLIPHLSYIGPALAMILSQAAAAYYSYLKCKGDVMLRVADFIGMPLLYSAIAAVVGLAVLALSNIIAALLIASAVYLTLIFRTRYITFNDFQGLILD